MYSDLPTPKRISLDATPMTQHSSVSRSHIVHTTFFSSLIRVLYIQISNSLKPRLELVWWPADGGDILAISTTLVTWWWHWPGVFLVASTPLSHTSTFFTLLSFCGIDKAVTSTSAATNTVTIGPDTARWSHPKLSLVCGKSSWHTVYIYPYANQLCYQSGIY